MTINEAFYKWACEAITNTTFKAILASHGLTVDLRQADRDNTIECFDHEGNAIILEC